MAKKKKKPAAKKGAAKKGEPEPEEKPKDTGEPNLMNELWDIHRGESHEFRQQSLMEANDIKRTLARDGVQIPIQTILSGVSMPE